MYNTRTEQTNEFKAVDAAGNSYDVIELTEIVEVRAADQSISRLSGIRTLHLPDGTSVQELGGEEYEISRSGTKLRKVK